MDPEERAALRGSLTAWLARGAARLASMEKQSADAAEWAQLYDSLDALGVLHVLFDADARHDLATVAEAAHCIAAHSPSLALLVVQQNLAARLLGDAGAARPRGWVALPLYDCAAEWQHQVWVRASGRVANVDGRWGSIPALPIASSVLLPLASAERGEFALVQSELPSAQPGVVREAAVRTLGLRGCPVADLACSGAAFSGASILASGAGAQIAVESLWSQAEVLMLAIRAGMLERGYSVARDYAAARWQGQKMIDGHTVVQRMLADVHGARCAMEESWREMCAAVVTDQPLTVGQLSTSQHFARALPCLASDCVQLLGGYGYIEELGQERLFRDAKQCEMLLGHPQAKRFSTWLREAG